MKAIVFAIVAMLSMTPTVNAEEPDYDGLCQVIAQTAEVVMKNRQVGVPMGTQLAVLEKTDSDRASSMLRKIIIDAYEEPHYATSEHKQRVTGDFRDEVHVQCLSAFEAKR